MVASWVEKHSFHVTSCARPTLWYALIWRLPPIPLTDFLCKWIAYVNAACSGFIARAQQHSPVTYDKQEAGRKKKKKANLATLKSFFFGESYIWEPESAFPFFYHHFLFSYSIASPCNPSLLPPIAQFSLCVFVLTFLSPDFDSDFVLFFPLCFFFFSSTPPLSLSFVFPAPRFLSLGELWIREAFWCQTATILHVNKKDGWKHSGSRTGTFFFLLVCHLVGKSSYLLQQRSIIIIGSRLWLRSY